MIPALARFVAALRAERHPVSPAEVIDASRALDLIGLERRAGVKVALRATLAKDRRAVEAFDRLFDRFFAAPRNDAKGEGAGRIASAGERSRTGDGNRAERPPTKPKETDRRRQAKASVPRPREDAPRTKQVADFERREGEKREGRLRRVRLRPPAQDPGDPAHRDLARRMTTDEEREIANEVPKMIQALKLRVGRRGTAARTGRPWLRRVLRDNLRHGGVPFVIPHRAPKRSTSRVVLLVDVSFSVARASGLFLLMAGAFVEMGRRARVLAFVDRPVDATAAVWRWSRGAARRERPSESARPRHRRGPRPGSGISRHDVSFADVLDGLDALNLDAPSDYGTAFHALRGSRLRPRGRDTVLVVLGDGRTNRFDPLDWAFADLARGCRTVLWLVPEPRSRWGTADSALPLYAVSTDLLVEATDLAGLARGLGELMRRL